jgi:hypothetical protein
LQGGLAALEVGNLFPFLLHDERSDPPLAGV